jgi:hypothetical protein
MSQRYETAGVLINRAAVACGLNKANDPFAAEDPSFTQLIEHANQLGQAILHYHYWELLIRQHEFVTQVGDTGIYDLPDDFGYMLDQTAWQKGAPGAAYPLLGPASPQIWSYLTASQLLNVTIYAWFRQADGKLQLWPQPPPPDIPIQFMYISRNWVIDGESPPENPVYKSEVSIYADIVRYDPLLFVKGLRLKFLEAKGFDTTKAQDEWNVVFDVIAGHNQPSPVLNVASSGLSLWRPLDGIVNVPETGFGN